LELFSLYISAVMLKKVSQNERSLMVLPLCSSLCCPSVHWGYRGGSPTAVQAWQTCPLWEPSPSHPI